MAKKKKKFYVVWQGRQPGIYRNWKDCKAAVSGYKNARFKSFPTLEAAKAAFDGPYTVQSGLPGLENLTSAQQNMLKEVNFNSIAVDAASSGNPGRLEYRGVDTRTQKKLFHIGPFEQGTNNIGEFLAIVHGLAFLHHHGSNRIIYSDSQVAINWVRRKKCNTKLQINAQNEKLFRLIRRGEKWLHNTNHSTPVVKWNTRSWGEIPADFGRK